MSFNLGDLLWKIQFLYTKTWVPVEAQIELPTTREATFCLTVATKWIGKTMDCLLKVGLVETTNMSNVSMSNLTMLCLCECLQAKY